MHPIINYSIQAHVEEEEGETDGQTLGASERTIGWTSEQGCPQVIVCHILGSFGPKHLKHKEMYKTTDAWLFLLHILPCLFMFDTAKPISEPTHFASYSATKILTQIVTLTIVFNFQYNKFWETLGTVAPKFTTSAKLKLWSNMLVGNANNARSNTKCSRSPVPDQISQHW